MAIMGVPGDKPLASKHDGYAASSVATQVRESLSKPVVIWVGNQPALRAFHNCRHHLPIA
jgi:hypothetical protein